MRQNRKNRLICLFILLLAGNIPNAFSQKRTFTISSVSDSTTLDSIPISLLSLKVFHKGIPLALATDYKLSSDHKKLIVMRPQKWDTLKVEYVRFPDWLIAERSHRKPVVVSSQEPVYISQADEQQGNSSDNGGVNTDGILLRGISFGNAQDLVLNSSLNLRMNGKISKDMSIEAAVTDQEFPFQPEGTTTTLQDFDRIYVQLKLPKLTVLLGDHAFASPSQLLFMKYAKKDRGLQLVGIDSGKRYSMRWEAAAALARGRFNRNEINGVEGQQGPYRLQGARGEQFIIIVSGTEVVYLDGKRMERGLQSDYIIDYNTGEVTFTPKHIINAYSRIVVEFQYSDRAYTRSVTGANVVMQSKKLDVFGALYSEQDAKNQPIQQDLEAYDSTSGMNARQILENAGDNLTIAVLSSVHSSTLFSNSVPNYIRHDTGNVTFYEYIEVADTHKLFYTVNFTYLGPGKGHYVLKGTVANGKAYRYVGEMNGVPAGDYEPITQLRSPNRISMAEGGFKFKPRNGTSVNVNAVYSSNDKNLFSEKDDADNQGGAVHLNVNDTRKLQPNDSTSKWYVASKVDAEHTSKHFTTIERYRDVEFGRQWDRNLYNPQNGLDPSSSDYGKAYVEMGNGKGFLVFAKGGANRSQLSKAITGAGGLKWNVKRFFAEPQAEFTQATYPSNNNFKRGNVDIGYRKPGLNVTLNGQQEQSKYSTPLVELLSQSYGFRQGGISIDNTGKKGMLSLALNRRVNNDVQATVLKDAVKVDNATLEWSLRGKRSGYLKVATSYRSMHLLDTFFQTKYANEDHVAGRLEYNFSKLLKLLSGNVFYQTISGREQQRQYSYFEVPAGQGFYTWVDFNGNGIKEVNEFQETSFKDQARYVRLLVPTGTYIKAQNTEFSGNLIVQPQSKKENKKIKLLNRLTWNYTGKSTEKAWYRRISPFIEKTSDLGILAMNVFVRDQLEAESGDGKFLGQYTAQDKGTKTIFTSGFDTRHSMSHILFFRGNVGRSWQVRSGFEQKQSDYTSQFIPQNSFSYLHRSVEPAVSWQPTSRVRITVTGKLAKDRSPGVTVADQFEGTFQMTHTVGKGGILDLKISSLQAKYYLTNGTPLSYDVLQGFSPGNNFRGIADLRFSASKNIQMVISYEGRKTADAKFIHIGRAEARYLF